MPARLLLHSETEIHHVKRVVALKDELFHNRCSVELLEFLHFGLSYSQLFETEEFVPPELLL